MKLRLKEVDRVEILTLQDNYIDITSKDSSDVVQRAIPLKDGEIRNSILAEHGFSSLLTTTAGDETHSMLFDFGFSEHGAAYNAKALNVDLTSVEVLALSHGHSDHTGGLTKLSEAVGKKGIKLILHPLAAHRQRYTRITRDFRIPFPSFSKVNTEAMEITLQETAAPMALVDGSFGFLGEVPRIVDFEKVGQNFVYDENGIETHDLIEDDTAMVVNVRGKGLVVLSGCAHSGIVNTVNHAREVTGINRIFAVMGGFHLNGADMKTVVEPTIRALKEFDPEYLIPTHCTGRDTIIAMEKAMPEKFILNMSGTKLVFAS
ncbi:MBL fold metallo-hydrolase [bacterium]|nr:MBL fold metallo-hydrolase [bacterium]